jgi:hypothetical protein
MQPRNCAHCGVELLQASGGIWLAKWVADLSGYCAKSPTDKHVPATGRPQVADEFDETNWQI